MAAVASGSGLLRDSPIPLHSQLRHLLVEKIEQGAIRSGDALPPERELAEQFGVSLAPVRRAILDLVSEGVLYRVRGKGTFLNEGSAVESVPILSSFSKSMKQRGLEVEMRLLRSQSVAAFRDIRHALATRGRVARLERLAVVQGEPVALFTSYLSAQRFPDVSAKLASSGSLATVLEEEFGVVAVRADVAVEVLRCSTVQSNLLQVLPGSSLLGAKGTSYGSDGDAIEHFHVQYRADRIRLCLESRRYAEQVVPRQRKRKGGEQ